MTPLEFEKRYHQIRVSYINERGLAESRTVDVHIYRQTGANAPLPEKDLLLRQLDEELRQAGGLRLIEVDRSHRDMIAAAFYGKGSPDDCARALMYALRYNRTRPEGLQRYCDQVAGIGLDCSGFVNKYFRAIGRINSDRHIDEYARGTLRDALSTIQPRDVLVLTDRRGNVLRHPDAHIAILESATDNNGRATVVEAASSMNGLTHSTYTFTRVDRNLFSVQRPASSTSRTGYVRVARAP